MNRGPRTSVHPIKRDSLGFRAQGETSAVRQHNELQIYERGYLEASTHPRLRHRTVGPRDQTAIGLAANEPVVNAEYLSTSPDRSSRALRHAGQVRDTAEGRLEGTGIQAPSRGSCRDSILDRSTSSNPLTFTRR